MGAAARAGSLGTRGQGIEVELMGVLLAETYRVFHDTGLEIHQIYRGPVT